MKLQVTLVRLCKQKGVSITKLAKEARVPRQTLHGWTTGRTAVNLNHLRRVASILQVSMYELAFDELDPFEPKEKGALKEIFRGDVHLIINKIERSTEA